MIRFQPFVSGPVNAAQESWNALLEYVGLLVIVGEKIKVPKISFSLAIPFFRTGFRGLDIVLCDFEHYCTDVITHVHRTGQSQGFKKLMRIMQEQVFLALQEVVLPAVVQGLLVQ